jgi:hypothetical protein
MFVCRVGDFLSCEVFAEESHRSGVVSLAGVVCVTVCVHVYHVAAAPCKWSTRGSLLTCELGVEGAAGGSWVQVERERVSAAVSGWVPGVRG